VNVLSGTLPVDVGDADVENVTVVLSPPVNVSGRVTIQGDLSSIPIGRGPQVSLIGTGETAPFFQSNSNSAGESFLIPSVRPGNYQVFVRPQPGLRGFVRSIRMGPEDGLFGTVSITTQTPPPLDIIISTNPGRLEVVVLNARREPSPNCRVVIVPDPLRRNRLDLFEAGFTDAAGRFGFDSLSPGAYKIFAWEDVEEGAWYDPEFMRINEVRGVPVTIAEGVAQRVELSVIPYQ
jgi:hypothetical protein